MNCPIDKTDLQMTERQGIEIDYCPTCRGVWLDRGELDKIIDRAAPSSSPAPAAPSRNEYREEYSRPSSHHQKHRREGLLGELFDF